MADSRLVRRSIWWIGLLLFSGAFAAPQEDRRARLVDSDDSRDARDISAEHEPAIITEPLPGQEFVIFSAGVGQGSNQFKSGRIIPGIRGGRRSEPPLLTSSGPVFEDGLWVPIDPITRDAGPVTAQGSTIPSARIETDNVDTVLEDGVLIAADHQSEATDSQPTADIPVQESNRTGRHSVPWSTQNGEDEATGSLPQEWRPLSLSELLSGAIIRPQDILPLNVTTEDAHQAAESSSEQTDSVSHEQEGNSSADETPTDDVSPEELVPNLSSEKTVQDLPADELASETSTDASDVQLATTLEQETAVTTAAPSDLDNEEVNLIPAESAVSSRSVIKKADNGVEYEYEYLYYYDDDDELVNRTQTFAEASLIDEEPAHKHTETSAEAVTEPSPAPLEQLNTEIVTEVTDAPIVVEEAPEVAEAPIVVEEAPEVAEAAIVVEQVPEVAETTEEPTTLAATSPTTTTTTTEATTTTTTTQATTTTEAPSTSASKSVHSRKPLRPNRFRVSTEAPAEVTTRFNRFKIVTSTSPATASSATEASVPEVTTRINRFRNRLSTQSAKTTTTASSETGEQSTTESPTSEVASKPNRGRFRFTTTTRKPIQEELDLAIPKRRNPGERINRIRPRIVDRSRNLALLEHRSGLTEKELELEASEQDWTSVPFDYEDEESTTLSEHLPHEEITDAVHLSPSHFETENEEAFHTRFPSRSHGSTTPLTPAEAEERTPLRIIESDSFRTAPASTSGEQQSLGRLQFISGPGAVQQESDGNGGFHSIFAVAEEDAGHQAQQAHREFHPVQKPADGSVDLLAFFRAVQEEEQQQQQQRQQQQENEPNIDQIIIEEVQQSEIDGLTTDSEPGVQPSPITFEELLANSPSVVFEEDETPAAEVSPAPVEKEEEEIVAQVPVEQEPSVDILPVPVDDEKPKDEPVDIEPAVPVAEEVSPEVVADQSADVSPVPVSDDKPAEVDSAVEDAPVPVAEEDAPVHSEPAVEVSPVSQEPSVVADEPVVQEEVDAVKEADKEDSNVVIEVPADEPTAEPSTTSTTTATTQATSTTASAEPSVDPEATTATSTTSKTRTPSRFANNNKFASKIRNRAREPVAISTPSTVSTAKPSFSRTSPSRRPSPVESVASDSIGESTPVRGNIRNRFNFRRTNATTSNEVTTSKPVEVTKKVTTPKRTTNNVRVNSLRTRPNVLQRGRSTTTTTTTESSVDIEEDTLATILPVADDVVVGEEVADKVTDEEKVDEELTDEASVKPSRFNRLELTTESTTTTTSTLEQRMNRLKKRPHLSVSSRPKTVSKPVSVNERRNRFSALNKKVEEKEADKSQLRQEEADEAIVEEPVELAKESPSVSTVPSSGSVSLMSLRSNRKPGQLAARRTPSASSSQ